MKELKDTVLVMDDEPHILDWLVEYLEAKDFKTILKINVEEAVNALENNKYRVTVLDLNIPATKKFRETLKERGDIYLQFPGLYVAEYARTKGHRGRQVIVYSVHDSDSVRETCNRIGVEYLIKGRPRSFKIELDRILSYDPTEKT